MKRMIIGLLAVTIAVVAVSFKESPVIKPKKTGDCYWFIVSDVDQENCDMANLDFPLTSSGPNPPTTEPTECDKETYCCAVGYSDFTIEGDHYEPAGTICGRLYKE